MTVVGNVEECDRAEQRPARLVLNEFGAILLLLLERFLLEEGLDTFITHFERQFSVRLSQLLGDQLELAQHRMIWFPSVSPWFYDIFVPENKIFKRPKDQNITKAAKN